MTAALSREQRTVMERLIQSARKWIEADLAESLERRFGMHASGRLEDPSSLSLSAAGMAVREDLVEIIEFLRAEGESAASAVERLTREAAFTHLNRLIAVRVAEAIRLVPETIGNGLASAGFRDFSELAPTVAETEWSRFAVFVRLCADELAPDVPALFDPRNPLLELELSEPLMRRVVETMAAVDEDVWAAPDTLGWAYQFFNTGEERREMRESSAPRNSRELAVRNQFFTPSYVVEFLVQNGLGAHLAAGFPELADELPLLVEVPTERIEVDLSQVSVLDPACGSGHFLLGAYDVLEKAWTLAGVEPEDAAPRIVESLWGIDIDPRATQIAQAAVIFRARRHCRGVLPMPNVICARALPAGPETDELIEGLPTAVGRAVRAIADELVDAPVLGPLLKVEERLDREVRDFFGTGVVEGTLAEAASREAEAVESQVLAALEQIADSVTSTAAQRLFAAEARDAVRFVEAMTRRYTAVLMNPPFGAPVPETRRYLKAAYPAASSSVDLLSVFVQRGLDLAQPDIGTCGAITSRTGLFLKTYERWRTEVLLGNGLVTLVDLGLGVMEGASVEACAYVIAHRTSNGACVFIRLLKDANRPEALTAAVRNHRKGIEDKRVFPVELAGIRSVPGAAISYWMSESLRMLFTNRPSLEGNGAELRAGLQTGDDFRFVRAFWEVDAKRIGYSSDETRNDKSWVPFAKGGEYSPYWADIHLVVDWAGGGEHLKAFDGSVVRNPRHQFLGGLTWLHRTTSGFGIRILPRGVAFSRQGCGAFPSGDTFSVLGWLSSRLVQAMLDAMVAGGEEATSAATSRSYEVGLVQKLPWFEIPEIAAIAKRLAGRVASHDRVDELTRGFIAVEPVERRDFELVLAQLEDSEYLDEVVNATARLDSEALEYLNDEVGPTALAYAMSTTLDDEVARLYCSSIPQAIEELVVRKGGSRVLTTLSHVADRRVEVIAHGLDVSPRSIVRVVRERGLVASGELEDRAFRLVSYLVGVALGRWDVRIGRDPLLADVPEDLLAPPARYSPGVLLGDDGLPPTSAPDGYPVDLPTDGVLVDQAGHRWDVTARVTEAARALFDTEEPVDKAMAVLMKRPSLDGFLRSQFFKQHLSMYSMSRRKAPIYWQLQVPSKSWGVWLYAPRLSREMLFAVVRETEQRQRLAEQQIGRLLREAETGGGGRSASEVAKVLDAEQRLAVELVTFRAEAERIANSEWEPDLDDGMVLNAAPLADLFPAWKDAAAYRDELRAGKYEWSTVARYAKQL